MRVTVRLFAQHRVSAGHACVTLELPPGSSAVDAVTAVVDLHADIDPRGSMLAVNSRYAKPDQALESGDEVALLPPVSGG